jgi:hypothetical protein
MEIADINNNAEITEACTTRKFLNTISKEKP